MPGRPLRTRRARQRTRHGFRNIVLVMSEASPPSSNVAAAGAGAGGSAPTAVRALGLLSLLLAALALTLAFYLTRRDNNLELRIAQEHADGLARDQHNTDLDRRLGELERQWAQAQSDADVTTGLVSSAELRRHREALALLDVERLVEQAQVQLRLGAAPSVAIDALSAADTRLGHMPGERAAHVQAALRHDLARLKAAPDFDRGALAARLDPLLVAVDGWRVSADPLHLGLRAAGAAPASAPNPPAVRPADTFGARLRAWIESEFGDLVRIREVSTPEALLLNPAQQQFLRERFRLGVLDLRQAILARDERMVRAEQAALENLLLNYFDPGQPAVAIALAQLRAIGSASTGAAPPTLEETLSALRAAHGVSDHGSNG